MNEPMTEVQRMILHYGGALGRAATVFTLTGISQPDPASGQRCLEAGRTLAGLRSAVGLADFDPETEFPLPDEDLSLRDVLRLFAPDIAMAVVLAGSMEPPASERTPPVVRIERRLTNVISVGLSALVAINGQDAIDQAYDEMIAVAKLLLAGGPGQFQA